MFHCDVVDVKKNSIDISKAQKFIASSKCGASLFFMGTVRDENNSQKVTGITYDSHDEMVKKSFEEIYDEAKVNFKIEHCAVFVEHVKVYVHLGGISILIAVACKHRKQVYDVSRFIIEEIKKRTAIWKKEHYEGTDSKWLKGNPLIDQSQLK